MQRVVARCFTRRSKRDYVPKIYKLPQYNPSTKKAHAKAQPRPETLKLHEEFYKDINRHDLMAQRKAMFADVRERFRLLQGYTLGPEDFEEALTHLNAPGDLASIQLNIQNCLRRNILVYDVEAIEYFLQKALQFRVEFGKEDFQLLLKGVTRFAVHYNYHQKSAFGSSLQEKRFAEVLRCIFELYKKGFSSDSKVTGRVELLFKHMHKCVSDTKHGFNSSTNFASFLTLLERYNEFNGKRMFDVQANILSLTPEEKNVMKSNKTMKADDLRWLFDKFPIKTA